MSDYYFYPAIALTGGADGALDAFDGSTLGNGDAAFVVNPTDFTFSVYTLDADNGQDEDSPSIIKPDANAGDKRWVLVMRGSYLGV